MESKWPFMLITCGLLAALGVLISSIEKEKIVQNWSDRRCDLTIMALATFFKPKDDTRSSTEFAKDNFSFCSSSVVNKFMDVAMKPRNYIFKQQVNLTGNSLGGMNILRGVTATMYESFQKYIGDFFGKFTVSVFEISRIIQYLRMAIRRLNGMMLSFIFAGISSFRAMLNSVRFIMKVILIMCAILFAAGFLLFFIIFPFMPLILTVFGIVIYWIVIINNLVGETSGGTIATRTDNFYNYCFSKDTQIVTKNGLVNVRDIKLGDELDSGKITAIMAMSGKNVKLYNLDGIYVSGSHLVKGDIWKSVSDDDRAVKTSVESDILYCFNTTSRTIPVHGSKGTVLFRDWEEIAEDDTKGQYMWNYLMLTKLNNYSNYSKWKDGLKITEIPFMNAKVKTRNGFVDISELRMYDTVLDREGKEQVILGIVTGHVVGQHTKYWHTELYEYNGVWIKGESTIMPGNDILTGTSLITETGEFIIMDGNEKLVRDFTEIGSDSIHETYPFVASRLNRL